MGIGEAIANPKLLDEAVAELAQITGQQPVITRAKNSLQTSNYVKVCQLDVRLL